jgi:hypothetical protein
LIGVEETDGNLLVCINSADTEYRIPFGMIQKARLKGRIDFNDRKDQDVI